MNDLYYCFCAIMSFILGMLMVYIEIYEIKEDYKEYKKIHIYPWNIVFLIYGIIFLYLCIAFINKTIY